MDNIQFWIYVIIAVIYLISRGRKKKQQTSADFPDFDEGQSHKNRPAPESQSRPISFEELLKEITEGKQPEKKEVVVQSQPTAYKKPEPSPYPTYADYDDDIEAEEKDLEEIPSNYRKKDKIYDVYEEAKKQAFVRPSLEETMKLEDTVVKYNRFKEFEIEQSRNLLAEYTRDLKDPEGLKRMVVMNEILNRRHF